MRHPAIALTIAAAIASSSNAATLEIPLDPKDKGRVFEGVGALSAGASSRLLIGYLDFSGTDTVNALSVAGGAKPPGVYSASNSDFITGPRSLTVLSSQVSD